MLRILSPWGYFQGYVQPKISYFSLNWIWLYNINEIESDHAEVFNKLFQGFRWFFPAFDNIYPIILCIVPTFIWIFALRLILVHYFPTFHASLSLFLPSCVTPILGIIPICLPPTLLFANYLFYDGSAYHKFHYSIFYTWNLR